MEKVRARRATRRYRSQVVSSPVLTQWNASGDAGDDPIDAVRSVDIKIVPRPVRRPVQLL